MQSKKHARDLLNKLSFTNQEVAEAAECSYSMIAQIRNGEREPSRLLEQKIIQFVKGKIEQLSKLLSANKS